MNAPNSSLAAEFSAALQWWRQAGVDYDYADDATDWLAANEPVPTRKSANEATQRDISSAKSQDTAAATNLVQRQDLLGESPPHDLDAFHKWWLEAPGLDAIGPRGRVAPRGPADAELMVLVVDPEERDGGRLLSGPQGKLLSRMLAAMGISEEQTYFASALPRHTPMPDTANLAAHGMDAVLAHHITLAAPKRVLAFGTNILPLIGHELTKDISSLREINQNPSSVPVMGCEGLDSLMTMPRLKARFWRRWIEWPRD